MRWKFSAPPSWITRLSLFLLVVALGALLLTSASAAPASGYRLDWYTVDGGGGSSAGGAYQLSGALGQPEGGPMAGGDYQLQGGFWQQSTYTAHLPLVVR